MHPPSAAACLPFGALAALLLVAGAGCGRPPTRVETGNQSQVLHLGNKTEPQDLDPHTVEGTPEHRILSSLLEGLVSEDPKDLHPVPGTAERWEISPDRRTYTFFLRTNALWSNGDPVTAADFLHSFRRMLSPTLAANYGYMLHVMENAEAYHRGDIADFSQVGLRALDAHTLQIRLSHPTPYFLSLLNHYTWFPVHRPTIEAHGPFERRGSRWTRPGRFVGNGPFVLADWRTQSRIVVRRNPRYWDQARVRLQEIHFHAIESPDTEERAFRAGQLHRTEELPPSRIPFYREHQPHLLREDPYLATYFYRVNVTRPALRDKRVRQALSLAIDREAIVRQVTRGGQQPAHHLTPPNLAGYRPAARLPGGIAEAKQLLRDAGFPDGRGLPPVEILYNTSEGHRAIAEALQEMWRKHLGVDTRLLNQEWKVYIDTERNLNYDLSRGGWTADYPDPYTFLGTFRGDGGNNQTGWKHPEYDRLLDASEAAATPEERFALLARAEAILVEECPIIPLYFYTRVYLLHPAVQGWYPTPIDHHPYKYLSLDPTR